MHHPRLLARLTRPAAAWLLGAAVQILAAPTIWAQTDTLPPGAPGPTTTPCLYTVGDTCYVADKNFTISVTAAVDAPGGTVSGVNPNGYRVCRSNDTTGWGGCDVNIYPNNGAVNNLLATIHRPPPGKRRAYYLMAQDNAGNWGPWNTPRYIATVPDITGPSAPGNTTSPNCVYTAGGTCYVNNTNFTIEVTAATDNADGSGVDPNGYRVCRSYDVTGWGGCDVNIFNAASRIVTVTAFHRPAPGQRRAYYFHARDMVGNAGPWNQPLYVETLSSALQSSGETSFATQALLEDKERTGGCAAWTVCGLLQALAGGYDPADFARELLAGERPELAVEIDPAFAARLIAGWPRQPDGRLDLERSPFTLRAIVKAAETAGEAPRASMVFTFISPDAKGAVATLRFDYEIAKDARAEEAWRQAWRRLSLIADRNSEAYRRQLQAITDSFARTPVDGQVNLVRLTSGWQ